LQLGISIESSFHFLTTNQVNLRRQISMGLSKGILYAGLAFAVCALGTPAKASSVPVFSDVSTDGTAVVTGTSSGATVISSGAHVDLVNGSVPSPPLTLLIGNAILTYVNMGTFDVITGGTGTKVISDGTNRVRLELSITSGIAMSGSFVVNAKIVSATNTLGNGLPDNYDFGTLVGGITTISINQTGTQFENILGHPGVSSSPSPVTVTELAVPEPTSMALLGIGMAGFFTYRRLFKRPATV
jgi:hypothetical protein